MPEFGERKEEKKIYPQIQGVTVSIILVGAGRVPSRYPINFVLRK
jgi:hypothetical protein